MKIKITQEMRKKMWMAIIVIAAGITIFFAFDKHKKYLFFNNTFYSGICNCFFVK